MIRLIAVREIVQRLRSRGFWLTTIGTPLLLIALAGLTMVVAGPIDRPLDALFELHTIEGLIVYVDEAGVIETIPYPAPQGVFIQFEDQDAAWEALAAGEIGAFYVIPIGYGKSAEIERFSLEVPAAAPDTRWMGWILIKNLLPEGDFRRTAQLRWPFNSGSPVFVNVGPQGESSPASGLLVPLVVVAPLLSSGSYLMEGLSDEKRSRVMEILVTSTKTGRLFWGKLLEIGIVTAMQYLIWSGLGLAMLLALPRALR